MDDSNKFVNTYIEIAVGQIHDNVNVLLQLRTQLKVANDTIAHLNQLVEELKKTDQDVNSAHNRARQWEEAHNAMLSKVSHLDTALSQITQMKKEIIERNNKIEKLEAELNNIKNPPRNKKTINTKAKNQLLVEDKPKVVELPPQKMVTDDF